MEVLTRKCLVVSTRVGRYIDSNVDRHRGLMKESRDGAVDTTVVVCRHAGGVQVGRF